MNNLNDTDGNVVGAFFGVIDNQGVEQVKPLYIPSSVPPAPIVAFELDLVGPAGGGVTLLSGAGMIHYKASSVLTASEYLPSCAQTSDFTLEISNSVYGLLPANTSNPIIQPFSVLVNTYFL